MSELKVACYAAGIIGSSFAVNFAMKGIECHVYVTNEDRKTRGTAAIERVIDSLKKLGVVDEEKKRAIWDKIRVTTDPTEAFSGVSLIQENGPEKLEVKREIMQIIDQYAPADAVFASSTSGMSITEIAALSAHPERCIGAHPFNPPHLIPLVEITKGEQTQQSYVDKALGIYRAAGKEPVVLNKEKKGFIANRFSHAVLREAMALVAEGVCSPEDADRALVYGPGIRWAVLGQYMVGELGSPGGVKAGMLRFQPMSESIFQDLENLQHMPPEIPDLAEAGVARYKAELPDSIGHTNEEIAAFRDRVLVELLRLHGKI